MPDNGDKRKLVHPPAWYCGKLYRGIYALEYRVIAEKILGRPLNNEEVVHHIDGDRENNSIDNIMIMDRKDHINYHNLIKKRKLVVFVCPICGKIFERLWGHTPLRKKRGGRAVLCGRKCGYTSIRKECRNLFFNYKYYILDIYREPKTLKQVFPRGVTATQCPLKTKF